MGLRRVGSGDQRRRRVLIEESLNLIDATAEAGAEQTPAAGVSAVRGASYSAAASLALQPSGVIVLASSPFQLTVAALGAVVVVVGLLAAYAQWAMWSPNSAVSVLSVLDLQRPGSLAAWVCSLLLITASFQAVQIYRLRRHKTDDYRGRYRVWQWLPGLLVAAAAAQATGVHRELINLAAALAAPKMAPASHAAWSVAGAVVWIGVAARWAVEIRASRWSLTFLVLGTSGYLLGLIVAQIPVQPISQMLVVLGSSACVMLGHASVFVSVLVYGRHVFLDSQGLLPTRTAQRRRGKSRAAQTAEEKKPAARRLAAKKKDVASEPKPAPAEERSPPTAQPATAPLAAASPQAPSPPEESSSASVLRWETEQRSNAARDARPDSAAADADGKLSKMERRRLKKLRQQEQFRRAA